jgi:hypothetical protein
MRQEKSGNPAVNTLPVSFLPMNIQNQKLLNMSGSMNIL